MDRSIDRVMGRKKKKKQIPRRCDFLWNFAKGYKVICWVNETERERGGRPWPILSKKRALQFFFCQTRPRRRTWEWRAGLRKLEINILRERSRQCPFRTFVAHLNIKLFDLFGHLLRISTSSYSTFCDFLNNLSTLVFVILQLFLVFDLFPIFYILLPFNLFDLLRFSTFLRIFVFLLFYDSSTFFHFFDILRLWISSYSTFFDLFDFFECLKRLYLFHSTQGSLIILLSTLEMSRLYLKIIQYSRDMFYTFFEWSPI